MPLTSVKTLIFRQANRVNGLFVEVIDFRRYFSKCQYANELRCSHGIRIPCRQNRSKSISI